MFQVDWRACCHERTVTNQYLSVVVGSRRHVQRDLGVAWDSSFVHLAVCNTESDVMDVVAGLCSLELRSQNIRVYLT